MRPRTTLASFATCSNRWLPDGYSRILRLYVFGPSGFWTMAPLRYAANFDPFLSLDCARVEGVGAQSGNLGQGHANPGLQLHKWRRERLCHAPVAGFTLRQVRPRVSGLKVQIAAHFQVLYFMQLFTIYVLCHFVT